METEFLDLEPTIVRIKQNLSGKKMPYGEGVTLTLIDPPIDSETMEGILTLLPADHIRISGTSRLMKLADSIKNFCLLHAKECEK